MLWVYKGRRKCMRKIRGTGEKRVGAGVFAAFRLKHSLRLCIAAINFNPDMYYKIIRSFKITRFTRPEPEQVFKGKRKAKA